MLNIQGSMNAFPLPILAGALLLALGGELQGEPASHQEESDYEQDYDLQQLAEWVRMEQSFSSSAREEAQRVIKEHREDRTVFSEAEFYMELRRVVGMADNGHSNVGTRVIHEWFGQLPLRTYWFSDGLYVVRAREPHENLLGARIEAIDGRPLGEVEERLMDYHGGSQAFFRQYTAATLMLCPPLLHAVGLSEGPDQLSLRLTDREGGSVEVVVEVDLESSPVRERPWRLLNPAPIRGEEGWATIHVDVEDLPLYLRDEGDMFRYEVLEEGNMVYIQLRGNVGSNVNSIESFLGEARRRLLEDRPRSIIFDNRQNPGGDLTRSAEFGLELPSLVSPDGKVYVLTGNATFSAGIYSSFFPKHADAARTVIVGEEVGDRPLFWAETGEPFALPDTGYGIGYSLQVHDLINGCEDPATCHMARHDPSWNISVDSLEPDWPVPTRFADFEALRDPVLERVLEDAMP